MDQISVHVMAVARIRQEVRDPAFVRLIEEGWRPIIYQAIAIRPEVWELVIVLAKPPPAVLAPIPHAGLALIALALILASQIGILVAILAR